MRIAKVVLALLGAVALSGCIFRGSGEVSTGGTVEYHSDGGSGGPPPGRGWKK